MTPSTLDHDAQVYWLVKDAEDEIIAWATRQGVAFVLLGALGLYFGVKHLASSAVEKIAKGRVDAAVDAVQRQLVGVTESHQHSASVASQELQRQLSAIESETRKRAAEITAEYREQLEALFTRKQRGLDASLASVQASRADAERLALLGLGRNLDDAPTIAGQAIRGRLSIDDARTMIGSDDAATRALGYTAIRLLRDKSAETLRELEAHAVREDDEDALAALIECLEQLNRGQPVPDWVLQVYRNGTGREATAGQAVTAIRRLGARGVPLLADALTSDASHYEALNAVASLGPVARPIQSTLSDFLQHPARWHLDVPHALSALEAITPEPRYSIPALSNVLVDTFCSRSDREFALRLVEKWGIGIHVSDSLVRELRSEYSDVPELAAQALIAIGELSASARISLAELSQSPNAELAELAKGVLAGVHK